MNNSHARSFWLEEALAAEDGQDQPELRRSIRADVCIVGGGYTGLWTAIHLKEADPGLSVVLVERDICGSGASGRNAGYLLSWWAKFLSLCKVCGEAEALRIARASDAAISEIERFCVAHQIDVDFQHDGWLWVGTNKAQVGLWRETMDAIARHGEAPIVEWTRDEVVARSGSPIHLAGVCETNAARVQPALLARGLRQVALERGVEIFEHSPLTELRLENPTVVRTPQGAVTAEKVILAMNAWGIRWAELRKAVVVVSGDMIITPPIPETLRRLGWTDGLTISDGRALLHYYRTTRDGRIAFGKGGMSGRFTFGGRVGSEVEGRSDFELQLLQLMRATYADLSDVGIATSWRGPVERSRSGLPFFSRLGKYGNVLFAIGFSGNGIGPCYLGGRILSSLALGRRDEWSECPLVRSPTRDFPPEPFRYVGSQLIRRALLAKDRADDEERAPSLAVRLLTSMAPAGLSPFEASVSAPAEASSRSSRPVSTSPQQP